MRIYRPMVWILLFYCLGFLLRVYYGGIFVVPGTLAVMIVTYCLTYKHVRSQKTIILTAFLLLLFGLWRGYGCFNEQREGYLEPIYGYTIEGDVMSIRESAYGITVKMKTDLWNIQLRADMDPGVQAGDRIKVSGTLIPLEPADNPGEMDWIVYYKNQGIEYTMEADSIRLLKQKSNNLFSARYRISDKVYDTLRNLLPEEEAGLAAAMLTGDRSAVDSEVQEVYRRSGIAHVIAISGLHIQILFSTISKIIGRIIPKRKGAVVTLLFIWMFCMLSGASVSTVRACIMLTIRNAAVLLHRSHDEASGLAAAALCLLLYRPLYMMDAGFQLSFGACYGLMQYGRLIQRLFGIPKRVRNALEPSTAATLATLPVTLFHYNQFSPYSIFLNLLVVPLMNLVLIMSGISVFLYILSPSLAVWSIGIVHFILHLYEKAGSWVLSIPGSILRTGTPPIVCIILYYAMMGLLVKRFSTLPKERGKNRSWILALVIFVIWLAAEYTTQTAFLSIGQGDCAVISVKGRTYIVDCGPASGYESVLKPYLNSRGIRTIDGVFVSHMDSDHSEGIRLLLQDDEFRVAKLFLPGHEKHEIDEDWSGMIEDIEYWSQGDNLQAPGIRIECISPIAQIEYADENEASMVLYIQLQNGKILMTGDTGKEAEALLADLELGCDILKIGHHGSDTSSSDSFLKQTGAALAWISCGENNSYGHPHEDVLARLSENQIPYAISHETGAVIYNRKGILKYKEAYRERWMD